MKGRQSAGHGSQTPLHICCTTAPQLISLYDGREGRVGHRRRWRYNVQVPIEEEANFIFLRGDGSYNVDPKFAHLLASSWYAAPLQESFKYGGSLDLTFRCMAGYCN